MPRRLGAQGAGSRVGQGQVVALVCLLQLLCSCQPATFVGEGCGAMAHACFAGVDATAAAWSGAGVDVGALARMPAGPRPRPMTRTPSSTRSPSLKATLRACKSLSSPRSRLPLASCLVPRACCLLPASCLKGCQVGIESRGAADGRGLAGGDALRQPRRGAQDARLGAACPG
jgi:hypothetical protein